MKRDPLPNLLMSMILVAAAVVALGAPDWLKVRQFLFGYPTDAGSLAVAAVICWIFIVATALISLLNSLRAATEAQFVQRRWTRAVMFLTAGVLIFGGGVAHRADLAYSMCCGGTPQGIQEATEVAR